MMIYIYIYSVVLFDFLNIGLNIDILMKYCVFYVICLVKILIILNMICLCKFVFELFNKIIVVFKLLFNMMF